MKGVNIIKKELNISHFRFEQLVDKYNMQYTMKSKTRMFEIEDFINLKQYIEDLERRLKDDYVDASKLKNLTSDLIRKMKYDSKSYIEIVPFQGRIKHYFLKSELENLKYKYTDNSFAVSITKDLEKDIIYFLKYIHGKNKKIIRSKVERRQDLTNIATYIVKDTKFKLQYAEKMGVIEHKRGEENLKMFDSQERFQKYVNTLREYETREDNRMNKFLESAKNRNKKIIERKI